MWTVAVGTGEAGRDGRVVIRGVKYPARRAVALSGVASGLLERGFGSSVEERAGELGLAFGNGFSVCFHG